MNMKIKPSEGKRKCKHESECPKMSMACLVLHEHKGQCKKCKKCGEWYQPTIEEVNYD